MRFLLVLLALTGLAQAAPSTPYDGPDAGSLVLSIAAKKTTYYTWIFLHYRPLGQSVTGKIKYSARGAFGTPHRDFQDDQNAGVVKIEKLRPGDYELYSFEVEFHWQSDLRKFGPDKPFSIPFTIAAGKATYLGEFRCVDVQAHSLLGVPIPGGAYFVLADQQARDVPIAQQAGLTGDIATSIPDPATIGSPFVRSTEATPEEVKALPPPSRPW